MEMAVRKIQKTGRNTFIVSLPRPWADAHRVKAGSLAHVSENTDGSLTIYVHEPRKNRVASVNADGPQPLRDLISAYIAGAERLVLNGQHASELAELSRDYLSAIDVIDEEPRRVTLQVFATGEEFALLVLLKRLNAVVASLFELANESFQDPASAEKTAARREREANRLYTLALRSMGAERSSVEFKFEALAANALENIADELEQFISEKPKHGKAVLSEIQQVYERTAREFFETQSGSDAITAQTELNEALTSLRQKSALEWARLNDVLRYCVELEDTATDLVALRNLAENDLTGKIEAVRTAKRK